MSEELNPEPPKTRPLKRRVAKPSAEGGAATKKVAKNISDFSEVKLRLLCSQIAGDLSKSWRFKLEVMFGLFLVTLAAAALVFGLIGSNVRETLKGEQNRIGNEIKNSLEKAKRGVEDRITEEFKADNVKHTIATTAAEQSQRILKQSVEPSITAFESKIASVTGDVESRFEKFNATVNRRQDQIASSLAEVEKELARLKARNELVALADSAIVDGDVEAYRKLDQLAQASTSDAQKAATVELFRVFQAYSILAPTRVHGMHLLADRINPTKTNETELTADELLPLLATMKEGLGRAKIGTLLSGKLKNGSYSQAEILYTALKKETHLEAIRYLGSAFSQVIGHPYEGKLDGRELIEWYEKNREQIKAKDADAKEAR